jgi:hypothetical protein
MPTLDCADRNRALTTVAELLGLTEAQVARACRSVNPDDRQTGDLLSALGRPPVPARFASYYFHGTRVLDPASFRLKGILPLSAVLDDLWGTLRTLAAGLCSAPEWERFRRHLAAGGLVDLYALKASDRLHWGPYGFLVRDAALCPAGSWSHNYLRAPEIIEDICLAFQSVYPSTPTLFERFSGASVPCLVKFVAPATGRDGALASALEYLVCVLQERELTFDVGHCFDAEAEAIPPERVVAVEVLSDP